MRRASAVKFNVISQSNVVFPRLRQPFKQRCHLSLGPLARADADYYGDSEFDYRTGRVYHGNTGSSSQEIDVLRVDGDNLVWSANTGIYGTATGGGAGEEPSFDWNHGSVNAFRRKSIERVMLLSKPALFPRSPFWNEFCQP